MKKWLVLLIICLPMLARAELPEQSLADPVAETRARTLMRDIRCLVCAGQSVADSDATLARDIRRMIRDEIAHGQNEKVIRERLRQQYGEGIFLRPAFNVQTSLLWLAPIILMGVGGLVIRSQFNWRRKGRAS